MAKRRRQAKKTVLFIGEGITEQAFLDYLKSIYISRGCGLSVKVQAANGGSPACILDYAIKQTRNRAYDRVAVLLDTDKEWGQKVKQDAKKNKIELIGSAPCIEGLILQLLKQPVPYASDNCKKQCQKLFKEKLTQKESYAEYLPIEYLDDIKAEFPVMERILIYFGDH
ncbi:MAG TPA: RloB domain-containing protein [Leucothrix mucor]|uniref:RloB domain-containing protein n=1 Tax=Leucothrix mucor TaxID=45248 RepID=A0A7V2T208_LEUMU|nr:RloB domain-containing protein [Leucothrix mucor]